MKGGYQFSQVPTASIPRSTFNRTHQHKTTFDSGYLIPFFVDEALPGDTFALNASVFARLATPLYPLMDSMKLDFFFFSVPNRLVWDNWQRFMGEQPNPGDSTDFLVPVLDTAVTSLGSGSVADYMGIPTGIVGLEVSALHFRAYNLIWNEWFRDENLQDRATVDKGDGPDPVGSYWLKRRGKRHDYFTSCLPWPQKGPGVNLPLGTSAPLIADTDNPTPTMHTTADATVRDMHADAPSGMYLNGLLGVGSPARWDNAGLVADLSSATAATINSLRQAFQIQKLLERDARGGTRYVELLRSHFGVTSPDARLQRPEFLGGGSVPVIVNPVAQTSEGTVDSPQGNLAAYGVAGGRGIGFTKSFVEHCVVIGLVCARADLTYQQGVHRMFSRRTRYDFYWPAFANLGEQAVLNKEIYAQGTAEDNEVFGYQERWAEYRYFPNKVTGKFRSTDATPLDAWHLAQEFTALPVLNAAFIEENPPVDRVIAVPDEPHFLFDSNIHLRCTRPMPTYSVPGLIDHF